MLTGYDAYYYDREYRRPLPVLRVKFDDPVANLAVHRCRTRRLSRPVRTFGRINRWLYQGLHHLDFPFLWQLRPAWDIVVIVFFSGRNSVELHRNLDRLPALADCN